jgi:hypothetical protein
MTKEEKAKDFERYKKMVVVAALTNVLMEYWEPFSSEKFVRGSLKKKANMFFEQLEKTVQFPIERLYKTDEKLFVAIQNSVEFILETDIINIIKKSREYAKLEENK